MYHQGRDAPAGADYTVQRLLLGTHTGGDEQNYLIFAEAKARALSAYHAPQM